MLTRLGLHPVFARNRKALETLLLAAVLPGVAGAVNATGLFAVGVYTSHMTGMVARIGTELVAGHAWLAARAIIFVLAFIAGAIASTVLIRPAQTGGRRRYWRALLVETAILAVFAALNGATDRGYFVNSLELTALLCLAMGLQNALVTKLSDARIRTTHLTGIVTDLGIEIVHVGEWWAAQRALRADPPLALLAKLRGDAEFVRLRLHLMVLGSFLAGATAGPALYVFWGHSAMFFPCGVLLVLAFFDFGLGFNRTPERRGTNPNLTKLA